MAREGGWAISYEGTSFSSRPPTNLILWYIYSMTFLDPLDSLKIISIPPFSDFQNIQVPPFYQPPLPPPVNNEWTLTNFQAHSQLSLKCKCL